jgi:acetaldehyde dehydrogenase
VAAVASAGPVPYAEIVSTVASRSAGPGTRQNIDEFTATTARSLEEVGGARRGKAIIVLNPADPPIVMRNTVFCALPDGYDRAAVAAAVEAMVERVARYVPGYRLKQPPVFEEARSPPRAVRPRPGWWSCSRSRGPATSCPRTPATSTS